jgi:tetratricopeptide (TPR) repeat protein
LIVVILSGFLLFQAMRLGVASHVAHSAWSNPKSKKSELNEASSQVRLAAHLDPGNADIALLLGQFQWRAQNRPADAIQTFRRASAISDDPLIPLFQAQIAFEENRLQDAVRAIDPLEGIADFLPGVGYIQGQIALNLGEPEEAAQAFLRDIRASSRFPNPEKVTPDLPGLYLKYGEALESLGHYREAVWQYEKYNQLIADRGSDIPIGSLRIGRIYRDRFSDFETARQFFEEALQSAQKHASSAEIEVVKEEIRQLNTLVRQIRADSPLHKEATDNSP